ncbi:LacI family transcriptional regulator [Haloferula luteola]|uniref:LacI family transcriptional regulator n=1 Tax=Haloferula luteola TaxID=595692 RepID=A0A840VHC5_9BACT|nr:LacI family DNA-binding transcriptional regulator [Haloferula luteola]MBB5353240.1 LacI family transcriptional regulator [Haloferula luteola]
MSLDSSQGKRVTRRVRLKDVAERAGVAVNTASTILNRRPNSWASKATIDRVFAAAKELGYRPNRAAVALQSGRFNTVGLLIADLKNPYFTHIASVLGVEFEKRGYDLVIESWRNDTEREKKLLRDFVDRNVDGMLCFFSDLDAHRDFLEKQSSSGPPIVALAMAGTGPSPVDKVMADFGTGMRQAASQLYADGHRKFAFLAARLKGHRVGRRPGLFQQIVSEMDGAEFRMIECGTEIAEAREAAAAVFASDDRPTAFIALNDLTAVGVIRAAADAGLRVPEDVSVVGIDGVPLSEFLTVSLSTVAQQHDAMLSQAVEFLMERIHGEDCEPREALLETAYVARESSGPAASH